MTEPAVLPAASASRVLALSLLVIARPSLLAGRPRALTRDQAIDLGRRYTDWFYAGADEALFHAMDPQVQASFGGPDGVARQRALLVQLGGVEGQLLEERLTLRHGYPQYWRCARFPLSDEPLVMRWVMNGAGEIVGVGLGRRRDVPDAEPV